MLDISGHSMRFCDRLERRTFLKIGGLALGGLSMPEILQAQSRSGTSDDDRAIIMIFLPGGPPHQDMFDLKPDAPREIRGEFRPIKTNVPGLEICELLPRLARRMDRLALIRTLVGSNAGHSAFQCLTGHNRQNQPPGGRPALGAVVSKKFGPATPGMPPFVGLSPKMGHHAWADNGQPGFLGPAHAPFKPEGDGKADLVLNGISLERLADRKRLLTSFDRFRRSADASGAMEGLDAYAQQAFGILTSSRLAEALDWQREDPRVIDRYGRGTFKNRNDGGPKTALPFLMARRLVQVGVRCVTLALSRWDWHHENFSQAREEFPRLDQGLSALLDDLKFHGLDEKVTVVVWGEFGRTPRINKNSGRDHWRLAFALLAGGGLRTGQVIGASDRHAAQPKERPVHFQEVFATLYHTLGIDTSSVTVDDLTGRPQYLVDHGRYPAIPELL